MASPWDGGTKVCSNCPGHMTKMAAMPIYGKNLKNLLIRNQKADDLTEMTRNSVNIKTLSPGGCMPLPPGYIHVLNHEKNCIKSDFKEIFLKLATNG